MTGYARSRDYVGNLYSLRRLENPTLIPTSHLKTGPRPSRCGCSVHGTRNERVGVCNERVGLCNERVGVCNERVGVCNERVEVCNERVGVFFSGMLGSVWDSPRRLQVPYVIPRPGVPRHINRVFTEIEVNFRVNYDILWLKCSFYRLVHGSMMRLWKCCALELNKFNKRLFSVAR